MTATANSKAKRIDINIDEKRLLKNRKNLFKHFDKEITEYAPDDIDFNRICRVNNNV